MRNTTGWFVALAIFVWGCGGDVRARIAVPTNSEQPSGDAAFETYEQAAAEMEEKGAKYIGRTAWSPDQRDQIVIAAAVPIRRISQIDGATFGRTWEEPFGVRESTRGWRTIGRALAWRIDAGVKTGDKADVRLCLATAIQMANALGTSDSHDATMGVEIVDECLDALWPSLPKFESATLAGISGDVRRLLDRDPGSGAIATQERTLMLAQYGWVYRHYQDRAFDEVGDTLGKAVDPAVKYLRDLTEKPAEEQQAYFTAFAGEIDEEVGLFQRRLATAPWRWASDEGRGARPWMRFTRSFGTSWRVFVERRAEVRTRLKLLAIDSALLEQFKLHGRVPTNLDGFPRSLRTDPYSGRDFAFISRGADYKLYSVGPNRSDDAGDRGDLGTGR